MMFEEMLPVTRGEREEWLRRKIGQYNRETRPTPDAIDTTMWTEQGPQGEDGSA